MLAHVGRECRCTHSMCIVQLPTLRLGSALQALGRAVPGRDVWIPARGRVGPVVVEGAQAKGALGRHRRGIVGALVLGKAGVMPGIWGSGFLRVQCCRQRVDFALQLGHATVGLFLALACGRCGDTWAACFGASPARQIWSFLVAAHLEASTGIACSGALQVGGRLAGSRGSVCAIVVAVILVVVLVMRRLGPGWRRLLKGGIEDVAEWGGLRQLRQLRGLLGLGMGVSGLGMVLSGGRREVVWMCRVLLGRRRVQLLGARRHRRGARKEPGIDLALVCHDGSVDVCSKVGVGGRIAPELPLWIAPRERAGRHA